MNRRQALEKVRHGFSEKVYEYLGRGSWRVYEHAIGGLSTETTRRIPDRVYAEHKATGARSLYFNGYFDVRPIDDGGFEDREVIVIDRRRDRDAEAAAAAGELLAHLVKRWF